MRALVGPLNRRDHGAVAGGLDGLDVRCLDRHDADVTFDAANESLGALRSRLPARFTPELLVWWSPEHALVPDGIEALEADAPVAAS
jgi:hypothetical protein